MTTGATVDALDLDVTLLTAASGRSPQLSAPRAALESAMLDIAWHAEKGDGEEEEGKVWSLECIIRDYDDGDARYVLRKCSVGGL